MKKKFPRTSLGKRTSTISNAMVHSIVYKSDLVDGYNKWLDRFNQKPGNEVCVYCGRKANSVDHIYNLVENGMPSGYNTEENNLVPCCSQCNSKKGAKHWKDFFETDYFKSFEDYEKRQRLFESIVTKYKPLKIDFKEVLGEDYYEYVEMQMKIKEMLVKNDKILEKMRNKVTLFVEYSK